MSSSERVHMDKRIQLLGVLNNMIISIFEDTMQIRKVSLVDIKMHLHQKHEIVECLQLESQLQQDELQHKGHVSKPLDNRNANNDDSKTLIHTNSSV